MLASMPSVKITLVLISGYGAGLKSLYRTLINESLIPSYYKKMQTLQDIKTQLNQGKTVSDAAIIAAADPGAHGQCRPAIR